MKMASGGGSGGQATMVIFGLKNMGGDEWKEISRLEQSGPDGGPILHSMDLSRLSDEELARLLGPAPHAATHERA